MLKFKFMDFYCTIILKVHSELALISLLSRRISVTVFLLAVIDERAYSLGRPWVLNLLLILLLWLRLFNRLVSDWSDRHVWFQGQVGMKLFLPWRCHIGCTSTVGRCWEDNRGVELLHHFRLHGALLCQTRVFSLHRWLIGYYGWLASGCGA